MPCAIVETARDTLRSQSRITALGGRSYTGIVSVEAPEKPNGRAREPGRSDDRSAAVLPRRDARRGDVRDVLVRDLLGHLLDEEPPVPGRRLGGRALLLLGRVVDVVPQRLVRRRGVVHHHLERRPALVELF